MKNKEITRILAVDWGTKRIGLALSDPTCTLASPLKVIEHRSRAEDAAVIVEAALEKGADLILVGVTYEDDHNLTPSGRSAARLADAIRTRTSVEVKLWSEEGSTLAAKQSGIEMGLPREKRKGHLDQVAAAIFLQRYLDEDE